MTIHFFIDGSFPHGMAAAKRRLCYAKGLMAEGHEVEVHVCHKCFEQGDNDGFPEEGVYQGIPYIYICGKYKHKGKLLRAFDWLILDYIRSFFHALKSVYKDEAMYVYLYPIFMQILLLLVARIKGAKIVKETCEHPSALGNINSRWHKFCKWFEYKFVMPHYDGFIAISRELDKFVCRYKSPKAESIIVPILVDTDICDEDFKGVESPYDVPYIIHTGTMHEQKDSVSKIIRAFARFKKETDSACKLVFTGPHANEQCKYISLMEELGVRDSVELLGLVSTEKVLILQHFASMSIIYKSDNLQTRNCFPTKLGEMLICGIPVITTTVGDSNMYLENGKSALIIEPDDEDTLVDYMNKILVDKELAAKIGMEGRRVAEKYFNPIYQGKRLANFFSNLLVNRYSGG